MFEQLASADLFVDDAQKAYDVLRGPLGLFEPRGIWCQVWPDWGFDARWCRTNLDLAVAPTHVEIIAPLDSPDPGIGHPHMRAMYDAQGSRAYKTHSTPVAVNDIEELVRRLSRAGAVFRLDEPEGALPFPRLWLGRTADQPGLYDPSADGGLYLEFVPALGFPTVSDSSKDLPAGHPVRRVSARTMIVDDLDSTLTTLDRNLGWTPGSAVQRRDHDRVATFTFDHPGSAALEVVQAGDRGRVRNYYEESGFGPYALAFEVADRASAVAALVDDGLLDEDPGTEVLRPDHRLTFGVQLEFHDGERSPGMTVTPTTHRWVGADGNILAGDVWGSGDPQVVLLHGGGQTRHAWGRTGQRFAERGLTTAAVDLRGHGESSWDSRARYAFPDHARDLTTLRHEVFTRPVILVGASLGGVTSLKSAQTDPLGIAAVVLVDITPTMQLEGVDKVVGFMRASPEGFGTLEEAADAIARYQPHRRRRATPEGLRRNLREDPATGRWFWHWDPRTLNFATPPWYAKQTRDMVAGTRALDEAGRPVHVVRGELSDVILPSDVESFLALGAHTRHLIVDGARHMVAGDANEVFLQRIFETLGEIDPRLAA